jgi:glycosyltransferase involved in cell wall biosynthesis
VPDRDSLTVVLLGPASSVHVRRWVTMLSNAGHRVIVASWQPGPELAGSDLRVAPAVGGSPLRRIPQAAVWLRRLIRETRPDVVHIHSLGAYGLLSLALPHGPVRVVTPWGSELRAARNSAGRAAVIRLAARRADLVLPTSPAVAAEMISRYSVPPSRTRVFSWGVAENLIAAHPSISPDAVRRAFGIPAGATVVLSVRSTAAAYRTLEIVSAFARAATDRPDLFLVVLGGHRPDRESARRAKASYLDRIGEAATSIRDRMLIVERTLPPEQTFELMCASDIAVSIPAGDQRSSSVLEAALAGCRLLLSDIAPYHEMINDGIAADLLPEPVTTSLAEHLRRVSADGVSRRNNQQFILAREHGAINLRRLETIYRQLSGSALTIM